MFGPFAVTVAVAIALLIGACGGKAQGGEPAGMWEYAINDPVLQMKAWTLAVPAGWKAEGTMLPGSSCDSATSPVYRAASADGMTGVYSLPRIDWAWGRGVRPGPDCLPIQEVVSARDFLTYMTRALDVGFVRESPDPQLAELHRQDEESSRRSGGNMKMQTDLAHYLVRYSVNGQPIEEWLSALVSCSDTMIVAVGHRYSCSAFVARWYAPLGKLEATMPTFRAMRLTLNQPWMDAWTAAMVRRVRALYQRETAALLQQGRLAQAARMREHQAFMDGMRRGRDIDNQRFREGQYQKQKNKEDTVDYVLDCQRLYSQGNRASVGNCPDRETQ